MKRLSRMIVFLALAVVLTACGGTFAQIHLQDTMEIPEDGIVTEQILNVIKADNAIGCFQGESNGYLYEWTIFGSDIDETEDIRLDLSIEAGTDSIDVSFAQEKPFGFPALLSIYLSEEWECLGATAYQQERPIGTVSVTGTEQTILNLSVNEPLGTIVILPDVSAEDAIVGDIMENRDGVNVDAPQKSMDSSNAELPTRHQDSYLTMVETEENRVYSNGVAGEKDKYQTDPIPAGKPMPVEPENQAINLDKGLTCTFSIECSTILNNLYDLDPDKLEMVPTGGNILAVTTVIFYEGESVFDVLQRLCKEKNIHLESSWTPIYNSAYVEGIHNLYEFDCGELSGWMYRVNGWYPNYGCSRYQLAQGDVVEWRYTCDYGKDIGCDWMR